MTSLKTCSVCLIGTRFDDGPVQTTSTLPLEAAISAVSEAEMSADAISTDDNCLFCFQLCSNKSISFTFMFGLRFRRIFGKSSPEFIDLIRLASALTRAG